MRIAFILFILVGLGIASVEWDSNSSSGEVDLNISFDTKKIANPDFDSLSTHTKESVEKVYTWIDSNDPSDN